MKKLIITTLQICLTVAILYWVFRDPEKRALMGVALKEADFSWFLIATAGFGLAVFIGICRWFLLLKAQGFGIGFLRTAALVFIGAFFNLFLLGSTGGDVVKIFYLLRETKTRRATAFLTVIMDRVIGLVALIFLAAILMAWKYSWITSNPGTTPYVHALIFLLAGSVGGIGFVALISALNLQDRLPAKMPMRDKFVEMAGAFRAYGQAPGTLLTCLGISAVAHLATFFSFFCLAKSVKAVVPVAEFFAIMPMISTFTAMPITFAGLGLREKLFEELLGKLSNVPAELAILIASGGFVITLIYGLVGGVIYLFYRSSTGETASLSEINATVEATEAKIVHP